jgi:glycosyltransferase involved in cell wall biosynthesis
MTQTRRVIVTDFSGESTVGGGQVFVTTLLNFLRLQPNIDLAYAGFEGRLSSAGDSHTEETSRTWKGPPSQSQAAPSGVLKRDSYPLKAFRLAVQLSSVPYHFSAELTFANNLLDPFLLRLRRLRTEVIIVIMHHAESDRFYTEAFKPRTTREAILRIVCRGSLAYWAKHSRLGIVVQNPTHRSRLGCEFQDSVIQIPTGVELEPVNPVAESPKKNQILYVGRMNEAEKRVSLLINAYALVKPRSWKLVLVGDGPDLGHYVELVSRLGIKDSVQFTGRVSEREKQRHLAEARIFVSPSVSESLGLNILEAMVAKLPVIAVRNQGSVSIIGEEENGILVEPKASDIAHALSKLIDNPALQEGLGVAANSRAQSMFSRSKSLDLLWRYSAELLDRRIIPAPARARS